MVLHNGLSNENQVIFFAESHEPIKLVAASQPVNRLFTKEPLPAAVMDRGRWRRS